MYTLREKKQPLNEMAYSTINNANENLPFDVVIRSPDHLTPHAYLFPRSIRDDKKELGQFLIPDRPPKYPGDIEGYKQGISDEQKDILVVWMNLRNKKFSKLTNWELLRIQFDFALNQ